MGGANYHNLPIHHGPVARSLVSAIRWLRGIKTNRFPWFLMPVSANRASSNPGHIVKLKYIRDKPNGAVVLTFINKGCFSCRWIFG